MLQSLTALRRGPRYGSLRGSSGWPSRISRAHSTCGCAARHSTRNDDPVRWVVRTIARTRAVSPRCITTRVFSLLRYGALPLPGADTAGRVRPDKLRGLRWWPSAPLAAMPNPLFARLSVVAEPPAGADEP